MKQRSVVQERRRGQRVEARLQIELELDCGSARTSTLNISSNGVYFTSRSFIAPLTKLGMRLMLPGAGEDAVLEPLDCQGIVVRCVPEKPQPGLDHYEVACYFTDTSEEFKARLSHYVQQHL